MPQILELCVQVRLLLRERVRRRPQILEIQLVSQERSQQRIVEQSVAFFVLQVVEDRERVADRNVEQSVDVTVPQILISWERE